MTSRVENAHGFAWFGSNLKGGTLWGQNGEHFWICEHRLSKLSCNLVWATRRIFVAKVEVILFPKCSSRVKSELRWALWIVRVQMVSKSCMDSPKAKYQVAIYGPGGGSGWNGLLLVLWNSRLWVRNKYTSVKLMYREYFLFSLPRVASTLRQRCWAACSRSE